MQVIEVDSISVNVNDAVAGPNPCFILVLLMLDTTGGSFTSPTVSVNDDAAELFPSETLMVIFDVPTLSATGAIATVQPLASDPNVMLPTGSNVVLLDVAVSAVPQLSVDSTSEMEM